MKTIAVVGLGIIGASLAGALTMAGYTVDGRDIDDETLALAKEFGYIRREADDLTAYEAVFIATPPTVAMRLLDTCPISRRGVRCGYLWCESLCRANRLRKAKKLPLYRFAPYGRERNVGYPFGVAHAFSKRQPCRCSCAPNGRRNLA